MLSEKVNGKIHQVTIKKNRAMSYENKELFRRVSLLFCLGTASCVGLSFMKEKTSIQLIRDRNEESRCLALLQSETISSRAYFGTANAKVGSLGDILLFLY